MSSAATRTSPTKIPLSPRSTNTHLSTLAGSLEVVQNGEELKAATRSSMEYHRQVLKEKLEDGELKYADLPPAHTHLCAWIVY
jgi:hypothetical protein